MATTQIFTGKTPTEVNADLDLVALRLVRMDLGDIRRSGARVDGVTDDSVATVAADTAVATTGGVVKFPKGLTRIRQNTTLAGDLIFERGAMISIDAGKQLLINGAILGDPKWQIFTGAGDVRFGNGQSEFRPEWFGVVPDDGTAAYSFDLVLLAALKVQADANMLAMQKLLDSLPGSKSTDLFQLRRQKTVVFRSLHYTFRPTLAAPLTIQNRRITFAPDRVGHQFTAVIRVYSFASDPEGLTTAPLFFVAGNPGAPPFFLNVSGEITFSPGLAFEAAPHFTQNNAVIQVGGKLNGAVYTASGASPVTGVNIDGCSFGQVYAMARFTYCGQCKFTNNLLDGGYYGVMMTHGVQELVVSGNRFNGTNFYPFYVNAETTLQNYNGDNVPNCRWLRFLNNEHSSYAGASYASYDGGLDGVLQIVNDLANMVYVVELRGNRCLGLGNIQQAHFAEAKSAVVYADFVTELFVRHNYFDEFLTVTLTGAGTGTVTATAGAATFSVSQAGGLANGDIVIVAGVFYVVSAFNGTTGCTLSGAPTFAASSFTKMTHPPLTHWPVLLQIAGAGSDKIYADHNTWNVTLDATAAAAGATWYSLPDSVASTNIPESATVTIADTAHFDLPFGFQFGRLEVMDVSDGNIALLQITKAVGSGEQSIIKQSSGLLYTIALGTATKVNIQWNAAAHKYRIENLTGAPRTLRIRPNYNSGDVNQ